MKINKTVLAIVTLIISSITLISSVYAVVRPAARSTIASPRSPVQRHAVTGPNRHPGNTVREPMSTGTAAKAAGVSDIRH